MNVAVRALVLLALAAPAPALAQKGMPIVTVRQMDDLAGTGQAAAFSTMIQTAVAGTGKFRTIESSFAHLRDQQELGNSGMVTTRTPGKKGGFEGADFLIYGTITSGSAGRQADMGADMGRALAGRMLGVSLGGGGCAKAVATLGVDIKIVDGATGEIRYANQINRTSTSATSCSGNPQTDVTNLLRAAANQIATGLVTTIYPIKVAAVQADGTLMLNYGEGAVLTGSLLNVYGPGQKIIDPDTGKVLSEEGAQIGTVRVTEVTPRFSKAAAVGAFSQPAAIGYIVRIAPPAAAGGGKGKRK